MLWAIRLVLKLVLRFWLVAIAFWAGVGVAFLVQLRELQKSWGVVPADRARGLTGDELIPDPDIIDTRSLVIDAPPSRVWPWLVQMGYGRGGWYSYDQLDMKGPSARTILSEHQALAEGDIMPTFPGGGFEARIVQAGKALVLYVDSELIQRQMEAAAAAAERGDRGAATSDEESPPGLQFAGAFGDMTMPEFRASWAFVLESEDGARTRLVERFRVRTAEAAFPQNLGMPLMGLGVFAMTRKHMLGVKERAETYAEDVTAAPPLEVATV